MAGVIIENLTKTYNLQGQQVKALAGVNLCVQDGSFVTVVGKSGCGKTTLLRVLCDLEQRTTGTFSFVGKDKSFLTAEQVKIGIVFQEPRLMPWLTVQENMGFSLLKHEQEDVVKERVNRYLEILGLMRFKDAYPEQISGGMAQRVALGRTLCYEPDLILMDEPLGALDAFNRQRLQRELLQIFQKNKKTVIFVTHDIDEAIFLGNKMVALEKGTVLQEMPVSLPYPRNVKDKSFFALREEVLTLLMHDDVQEDKVTR